MTAVMKALARVMMAPLMMVMNMVNRIERNVASGDAVLALNLLLLRSRLQRRCDCGCKLQLLLLCCQCCYRRWW